MDLARKLTVLEYGVAAVTDKVVVNVRAVVKLMIAAILRNPDFGPNIWSLSH
jgi:hypothetical protein